MIVSYQWLKKLVDFDYTPQELASKLTQIGLEVASITNYGQDISGVIIGKVTDVKSHPESDHLKLCKVEAEDKTYSVVCGAPNVDIGQLVPLAVEGAKLPCGKTIRNTVVLGIESEGMICSEKELGLGDDHSGIMVLDESIRTINDLSDWVLEIELTPNRPDCLNHIGIAREIAIICGTEIKLPHIDFNEAGLLKKESFPISIIEPDLCENYSAFIIRGVKVGPSPFWLSNSLKKNGLRSINNIVDITNYILMKMGHPLHAFDLDKLNGPEIIVRRASKGEHIITLDGKDRILDDTMLVIADSEKPVALAGIMGGSESEVTDSTQNILLEGAYFNPVSIRKTSKSVGLSTEASYRFERGTDRIGFKDALRRAAYMIALIGGADSISQMMEIDAKPSIKKVIKCNLENVKSILGFEIKDDLIKSTIKKLNIIIIDQKRSELTLELPSFRVDLAIEEDIIEEIARIYGYDNIPADFPGSKFSEIELNRKYIFSNRTRNLFAGAGFYETITCSLVHTDVNKQWPSYFAKNGLSPLCVKNPISEAQHALQTSLIPNLINVIELNEKQKIENIRLFEIGNVFIPKHDNVYNENLMLSVAVSGKQNRLFWDEKTQKSWDFFDFKGVIEDYFANIGIDNIRFEKSEVSYLHPGKASSILLDNEPIGIFGQLHPLLAKEKGIDKNTFIAEVNAESLINNLKIQGHYSVITKFPFVERDLAIVIKSDTSFQFIKDSLSSILPELLEEYFLVSIYEGKPIPEGKKSLSLRMRYRSKEKTLTDFEVDEIHNSFAKNLVTKLGCELR